MRVMLVDLVMVTTLRRSLPCSLLAVNFLVEPVIAIPVPLPSERRRRTWAPGARAPT
jgi:hypothetical protein